MNKRKKNRRRGIRVLKGGILVRERNLEKLYKLSSVAEKADVSIRTVQKHVREGLLPIVYSGPHAAIRVRETEVERYLINEKSRSEE